MFEFGESFRPVAVGRDDRAGIPRRSVLMGVEMEKQASVRQVYGSPLPEELADTAAGRLGIRSPDRAHAPAPVARAGSARGQRLVLAIDFDPALIMAVLGHPGVVHHRARPDAPGEA